MPYNVLIVDDSRTIRSIIIKTLRLTKLDIGEIFEASNGKEGLECIEKHRIHVILSDLNMPVMSGLEMVAAMEKDGILNDIPVIVVSTDGSATRIEELKRKGVKHYIRKPFTPESIGNAIDKVLGVTK